MRSMLGGVSYDLRRYRVDHEGYPVLWWLPIPGFVHQPLFRWSRAWEYTVLALGPEGERWGGVPPEFDEVKRLADACGVQLALAFLPELSRPFGEPPDVVDETHRSLKSWASTNGVPTVDVGQAFKGSYDHEAIRLDPCCHYNDAGHEALARLFLDWIPQLMPEPSPPRTCQVN